MARQWYSKAHYERVSPKPDSPQDIADRRTLNAILDTVRTEMAEKFPKITADNAEAAMQYQAERIKFLRAEAFGPGR